MKNLTRLNLANNAIQNIPNNLCCLSHLKDLRLNGNPIRTLRNDILSSGTTRVLKILRERHVGEKTNDDCDSSSTETTYPKKYDMRKSKELDLHDRQLSQVPNLLKLVADAKEAEISSLDLSSNNFEDFFCEFSDLATQVREINLASNNIKQLADFIGDFQYLIYFNISRNSLVSLPDTIEKLHYLRELDISHNR